MPDLRLSANEKGALCSPVKIRSEDHEHDRVERVTDIATANHGQVVDWSR